MTLNLSGKCHHWLCVLLGRSSFLKKCFERAIQEVNENNRDWLKPIRILNEEIEEAQLSKYIHKGIVNHDRWSMVDYFRCFPFQKPKNYYCIHWMNEEWRRRNLDKDECIRYSMLDKLMHKHDIPVKRRLLDNYVPRLIKNRLIHLIVPLIPVPARKPIKKMIAFFKKRFFHRFHLGDSRLSIWIFGGLGFINTRDRVKTGACARWKGVYRAIPDIWRWCAGQLQYPDP